MKVVPVRSSPPIGCQPPALVHDEEFIAQCAGHRAPDATLPQPTVGLAVRTGAEKSAAAKVCVGVAVDVAVEVGVGGVGVSLEVAVCAPGGDAVGV